MIMMNLRNTFNEDSFEYTTMNDIMAEGMRQPKRQALYKTSGMKMKCVFCLAQVIVGKYLCNANSQAHCPRTADSVF